MQDPQHAADVAHRLAERVKELTALRQAARILADSSTTAPELLEGIARLLPPAFQFPDITEALRRVTRGSSGRRRGYVVDSPWTLRSSFRTYDGVEGALDVVYREARPDVRRGPLSRRGTAPPRRARRDAPVRARSAPRRGAHPPAAESDQRRDLGAGSRAICSGTISKLLREDIRHHFASVILWDEQAQRAATARAGLSRGHGGDSRRRDRQHGPHHRP